MRSQPGMPGRWGRDGLLFCLVLLLSGLMVPAVQAQSFGPPVSPDLLLVLLDRQGNVRFTLSAYNATWESPFRVRVDTFSYALLQPVSGQVSLIGEASASPLIEASYYLSRRWAVGLWYNPIHDSSKAKYVQIADVPLLVKISRDANLGDLHVMYYGPYGLTAQLGYYREDGTYHVQSRVPVPNSEVRKFSSDDTQRSLNLWVSERLDVHAKRYLIQPFVSVGYHSSSSLNHAVSILTGVALTLNAKLSLSGSVWLFDLSHAATRITAGLVYRL
jgi:hypothetical protein